MILELFFKNYFDFLATFEKEEQKHILN